MGTGRADTQAGQGVFGTRGRTLAAVALLVVLVDLGTPQLWTHEGRWGDIARQMQDSRDYLHPRLLGELYFDKPVLSYWLMLAASSLLGGLTETALRLPSALAALATLGCVVRIGTRRWDRRTGLTAGWVLLSAGMFVVWGRVASADMLNVAAVTGAVTWYMERRDRPGLVTALGFGLILGVGALMKGLVAPAMACLAVLPDLVAGGRWRRFLRPSLLPGLAVGAAVVLSPYVLAGPSGVSEGLGLLYRENVVRYFSAFDHRGSPATYLGSLPLYVLPWTLVLPWLALWLVRGRRRLGSGTRWAAAATLLLFLFLTASSSRRSYYVLPLVPFVALLTAAWLEDPAATARRVRLARRLAGASLTLLLVWFGVLQPLAMHQGGMRVLRREVVARAATRLPGDDWRLLVLDTGPAAAYYLRPPGPAATRLSVSDRAAVRRFLADHPRTIVVTRREYGDRVAALLGPAVRLDERSPIPAWLPVPHADDRLTEVFVRAGPDAGTPATH